ncbi:dioxygenase [Kitasatospora nipponensis]|uniref:Dioxygenase n=1 Tax=Kitasatospora nipponensis TaxID=258049 RepID=A0ABP4H688_9ACTN
MPHPHDPREPLAHDPSARDEHLISRKSLLKAAALASAVPLVTGGGIALARDRAGTGGALSATPQCEDGDAPTVAQIEGPYFKPNSPLRTSLVTAGTVGTPLTVTGFVFGRACVPIAGVLLDFWQADDAGNYDNTGFTFRGHQFTDAHGAFSLTTIVPGLYPGRTRHIHVKAQAPGRPILTTQLYFPGEPSNSSDSIFDARLLMDVRQVGNGEQAAFDFVLDIAQTPTPTPTGPTRTPTPTPTPTPSATATTSPTTQPGGTWAAGTTYRTGDQVTYSSLGYRCLQGHTAITGWEPPYVPALWQRL